jgi:hypothetical protein
LRLATFFERTARLAIVFERTARLAIVFDSATGAAAAADLGEDFVVEAEFFSGLKLLVSDFFWIAMIVFLLEMSSDQLEILFAGLCHCSLQASCQTRRPRKYSGLGDF